MNEIPNNRKRTNTNDRLRKTKKLGSQDFLNLSN